VGSAAKSPPPPPRTGLLAFPHSASTSAMMSPPPVIESKVSREEISASKQLRLFSPGSSGGGRSSPRRSSPAAAPLSSGTQLSISRLSRERGRDLGVSGRSSLMISTLLAREDMSSGLGGGASSSPSSLSFDRNLTLPKRPFRPRRWRWRPAGRDAVRTRRSSAPLRPPLSNNRKPRDLAEPAEETEARAAALAAGAPSSPSSSSSACSLSPRLTSRPFSFSRRCSESGGNPSAPLLLMAGDDDDVPLSSFLLRRENMLPGLRFPNSLNPFRIFPLDWDSQGGGGSMLSVCTSIFSLVQPLCPPVSRCRSSSPARGESV